MYNVTSTERGTAGVSGQFPESLRVHYRISLLGYLVTIQVETYFRFLYFARFWTAGRAGWSFVPLPVLLSFRLCLKFTAQ